jgi:hypothetical protein
MVRVGGYSIGMISARGSPSPMVSLAMVQAGWRRRSAALPGLSSSRPEASSR